jgi:hypothetical protein
VIAREFTQPAKCQRCGKPSAAWRTGRGKSAFCEQCRTLPPAPTVAAAPKMHPVLAEWLKGSPERLVITSPTGVQLRICGGTYESPRTAVFENIGSAASAIESNTVSWQKVREPKALTTNAEAAGSGLDGMHFVRAS